MLTYNIVLNKLINLGVIGVFIAIGSVFLINFNTLNNTKQYALVFDEPVASLICGSKVMIQGVAVGIVSDITLLSEDRRKALVIIKLAPVEIEKLNAEIMVSNFMGNGYVNLRYQKDPVPPLPPVHGYPQIRVQPSIMKKLYDFMDQIMQKIQEEESSGHINVLISDFVQSVEILNRSVKQAGLAAMKIVDNIEALTESTRSFSVQISEHNKAAKLMSELGVTLGQVQSLILDGNNLIKDAHKALILFKGHPLHFITKKNDPAHKLHIKAVGS